MKKSLVTLGSVAILSGAYATHTEAAEYTVQSGDTLWTIANQSNTTIDQLKTINKLDSNIIFPGDVIVTDGEGETKEESADTYTVKSGDTLSIIGEKFGVSYQSIMEWNGLTSDLIFPGQVFNVTGPATTEVIEEETTEVTKAAEPVQEVSYTENTVQAEQVPEVVAPTPKIVETTQSTQQTVEVAEPVQEVAETIQPTQQTVEVAEPVQQVQTQNLSTQNTQPAATPAGGNAQSVALSVAAGKSYVYGANTAYAVDCSSFTQQFMQQYKGINLSRTTYGQAAEGTPVSNPQPGDLVFFNNYSHVGVYVGNGMMVDALNPSEGVGLRAVSYVHGHVDGYYRY